MTRKVRRKKTTLYIIWQDCSLSSALLVMNKSVLQNNRFNALIHLHGIDTFPDSEGGSLFSLVQTADER